MDSCHAYFVDVATTVDKENCKLILQDGRLSLVAIKTIESGDQLITRYGHQHWCKSKWPLLLLLQMYEKYKLLNLTATEYAQWNEIIAIKNLEEQRYLWTLSPKPILRNTTPECQQPPVASKKPTVCPARPNKIQRKQTWRTQGTLSSRGQWSHSTWNSSARTLTSATS
jgi:hypothetical protein